MPGGTAAPKGAGTGPGVKAAGAGGRPCERDRPALPRGGRGGAPQQEPVTVAVLWAGTRMVMSWPVCT